MTCAVCRGCHYCWGGRTAEPQVVPCPACNGGPKPLWLDELTIPKREVRRGWDWASKVLRGGTG